MLMAKPLQPAPSATQRGPLWHWLILLAALLVLGAQIGFDLFQSRQRIEVEAVNRLENHSLVLAEELERRLNSTNVALETLRSKAIATATSQTSQSSMAALTSDLETLTHAIEGLRTLAVFDAAGNVVACNRPELIGRNFSQRDYFITARQNPDAAVLFLSEPFTTTLGVYTVMLSRIVPGKNGEFAGIVNATIDNQEIANLMLSMHAGQETTLSVVHGGGKLLVLVPEQKTASPGMLLNVPDSLFRRHLDSGQTASLLRGRSVVTGTERFMSMRTLQPPALHMNMPLMVGAARDRDEVLAEWRNQLLMRLLLFAGVAASTVMGMWLYQRRQRQLERLMQDKENELRRSVALLQGFIDNLPGTAYVKDANSQTLMANRSFQTLLGIDPASMIGKTSRELFPGEFGDKITTDDQEVFASGSTRVIEESFNGRDYESVKFVIDDGYGQPCLGGMTMDITARKQTERAMASQMQLLREVNHKLEEAHTQLLQSEKMASIGQLAAGVAHELNNPIGFVYSNLGTLEEYLKDIFEISQACERAAATAANPADFAHINTLKAEKQFDFLANDIFALMRESKDGIVRVKKIIDDLKNFSRVGETEWQLADIHQGLDSTLNVVWNELKYKCTVTKHYATDLPSIMCLQAQLNQVFMNLLINSAQAIESAGQIIITTRRLDDEHIELSFSDNGKGIAPEHLKRIFDPFFTTKPVGQGTGLGLSITYGIINKHHGKIEVRSQPGVGTTFTIVLPVQQPLTEAAA